jgi:hypothetical protein
MIAARIRRTRFRFRVHASRIDRRMSLIFLAAIVAAFAAAFAIGRATPAATEGPTRESFVEPFGASAQVGIPRSLSGVPPIAASLSTKTHDHSSRKSTPATTSSSSSVVTAQSDSAGLVSPVLARRPRLGTPSVPSTPPHTGAVPSTGGVPSTGVAPPPTSGPSHAGTHSGNGGSFDSSG